jgi:hypothetical protein
MDGTAWVFWRTRLIWGVNEMLSLAKSSVIVAVYLAATGIASAVGMPGMPMIDMTQPFVAVKAPEVPLHLGDIYGPGLKKLEGQVVARVVANCPYHLSASFEGLRHQEGKAAISPKDMAVTINGKAVPVGKTRVPIVTNGHPTSRSGADIPIQLQVMVKGLATYPAGRYGGTLVLTIMAGP